MYTLYHAGTFNAEDHRLNGGSLLEEWQILSADPPTQLRKVGDAFWLSASGVGAIRFTTSSRMISAYRQNGIQNETFERALVHEWLPLVYQAWGFQVLHASAVVHPPSGKTIAFAGETGSGKSTLAFGFGKRSNWKQISDDSLAFTMQTGKVKLIPIPNNVRLRPASARYYGQKPYSHEPVNLPEMDLGLDYVLFIERNDGTFLSKKLVIDKPINGLQTFLQLLRNAYALTIKIPEHNERLLHDYIRLAHQV